MTAGGVRPDLSIVIVSWNVAEYLRGCLRSIAAGDGGAITGESSPIEVIVVDNCSGDDTLAMLAGEFPWVRVIANPENRGFTVANNQALAIAQGRHVMLLNPDTTVLPVAGEGPSPLARLVRYLDEHPDVGVVGPRLVYPDGATQSSRRRFPTLATAFCESTVLERFWSNSPPIQRYRLTDRPDDVEQDVDWLVGACLVVRSTAIDAVGGLDEGFFMYSEEVDWCRRIRSAGWRVVYLPSVTVMHHEGRSSEQNLARRDILFNESKCRYFRKHHGWFAAELIRIFLVATFALQAAEELAKAPFAGADRPRRRRRASMLGEVLAWQVRRLLRGHRSPA